MDSLLPQLDPQTTQTLIQEIGIRYTETQPTHTPNKQVEAWVYNDGADFWLYVWANGAWRSQKLGVTQATTTPSTEFDTWQFSVPGSTSVDTTATNDFGFVPKMVFGTLSGGGTSTVDFFAMWQDGREQATSVVSDGHGASGVSFLGADASFYVSNLSVSDTELTVHYKNTGLSSATCTLWVIGTSS